MPLRAVVRAPGTRHVATRTGSAIPLVATIAAEIADTVLQDVRTAIPAASIRGEFPTDVLGEGLGNVDLFRWDRNMLIQSDRAATSPDRRDFLIQPVLAGEKVVALSARHGDRFYAGFLRVDVAEGQHVDLGELCLGE